MKQLNSQRQKLENTRSSHKAKFGELKDLINGSYQQTFTLQTLQQSIGETSATKDKQVFHEGYSVVKIGLTCE